MKQKKIYIIRKFIVATSIKDALKKERDKEVDDCWSDEGSHKLLLEKQIDSSMQFLTKK